MRAGDERSEPQGRSVLRQCKKWREEPEALRAILLDTPVTETFKWRLPCYAFQDGNVATVWGFRERRVRKMRMRQNMQPLAAWSNAVTVHPTQSGIHPPPGVAAQAARFRTGQTKHSGGIE
jgi:hypothetical protein